MMCLVAAVLISVAAPALSASVPTAPLVTAREVLAKKRPYKYRHKVKKGETLTGVARLHQVKLNDLMSINNLNRGSVLEVGQRLRVR